MTTDFRTLLENLVEEVLDANQYKPPGVQRAIDRACAALAEPEPEEPTPAGPSDDELDELFTDIDQSGEPESWRAFARAVLARWGRPAPQPVPVSDRLPGPGDCDAEGECYWFNPKGSGAWYQNTYQGNYTHWLPAHALPMPS